MVKDDKGKMTEKEKVKHRDMDKAYVEQDIDEVFCGFKCLQFLAKRETYLLVYCIIGFVIGMFFTYSIATISTLEKRFKLNSKLTGIMLAGNDVSQVIFAMLASYYGNYGNRPKWLGIGVITASISCLLAATPHFIYGPGQDAVDVANNAMLIQQSGNVSSMANSPTLKSEMCYAPYEGDCFNDDSTNYGAAIIIFVAQFFVGCAVSVFYSLGLLYLDDNVDKKDTPIYYAISLIVRIAGPVLGFLLASRCLSIYIDPNYEPNISLRDPRWLGAWWLGYIILMVLLAGCGGLVLLFPRTLPRTMTKLMQVEQNKSNSKVIVEVNAQSNLQQLLEMVKKSRQTVKPSLKALPAALKRLVTNKIWLGFQYNTILDLLALMGYWSFKPKYLEYQFRMSAARATFYTGVAGLISSIVGLAISGIIIKVFKPNARFVAGYSCFLTVFSSATIFSLMFIGCPQLNVIGPNFQDNSTSMTVVGCSDDCECSDRYAPVCSKDGINTFYSPCYAGCTKMNSSASPVEYYDCKCIAPYNETSLNGKESSESYEDYGRAVQGYCPEKCQSFFYYIVATIVTKVISSSGRIGGTMLFLRSFKEHDKGIALGTSTMLISLFAFIPGPIIMGAIVDTTCIIWDNTCGNTGNCWLYDSNKFRILIHAVPAAMILLALAGDILIFVYCKDINLYGEEAEMKMPISEEQIPLKNKDQTDTDPNDKKLITSKDTKEET